MSEAADRFLDSWHRMVAGRDLEALRELLAPGVSIAPPPYWSRIEGREAVHFLLSLILETIEGFRYRREWRDGSELALEFLGSVGGRELQGIDLIHLDSAGRVAELDVLIRPAPAVEALREIIAPRMTGFLARSTPPAS